MEDMHILTSNKEVRDIYPTGTYYICAYHLYDDPLYDDDVKQVIDADDILGIVNRNLIHAEDGKGCLFYRGVWATIINSPSKEPYLIY